MKMPCPSCGRLVRVLEPRTGGSGRRHPMPWRRQQHYLPDSAMRCRHPTNLTVTELGVVLIQRLAEDTATPEEGPDTCN